MLLRLPRCVLPTLVAGVVNLALQVMNLTVSRSFDVVDCVIAFLNHCLVNRSKLARAFCVSMPTIDDWIRRGCPVVQKGARGRSAKFSLSDVRAWRVKDQRRHYDKRQRRDMEQAGQEHLNDLRIRVEDSARHFLYYAFNVGAGILVEYLMEKRGISQLEAKKIVAAFHLHLAYIYQDWLRSDAYNKTLKNEKGEGLDDEFREMTCGGYKTNWTSAPPTNFDINTGCPLPPVIEQYMNEISGRKKQKHEH